MIKGIKEITKNLATTTTMITAMLNIQLQTSFNAFMLKNIGITNRHLAFGYKRNFRRSASSSNDSHHDNLTVMASSSLSPLDENYFLKQVEITIANVLSEHRNSNSNNNENENNSRDNISNADFEVEDLDIMDLPGPQREAFGIARHLYRRLSALRRNNDCPRCWMQRTHCICSHCKSVSPTIFHHNKKYFHNDNKNNNYDKQTTRYQNESSVDSSSSSKPLSVLKRIFVIMHHKEIGLKVDTAKLILASFPFQCELVIGGIGPRYQYSMKKLLESIDDPTTTSLVLFPDKSANTLKEIIVNNKLSNGRNSQNQPHIICDNKKDNDNNRDYDLIVFDGTWAQARKFHSRYFPPLIEDNNEDNNKDNRRRILSLRNVKLSDEAVQLLHNGSTQTGEYQLRRHVIPWRQVGTFEAFRVFLSDWCQEFPNDNTNNKNDVKDDDDYNDRKVWQQIESYQRIANAAALRELPPINKIQ